MTRAYLSDFDHLTPAQRATVTHWIIDDPDRGGEKTYSTQPSTADIAWDINRERREGWME
jgi:hypothetical protein